MHRCRQCGSTTTPGAYDCAVCGTLTLMSLRAECETRTDHRLHPLSHALLSGTLGGTWIYFASTWLFWVPAEALGASVAVGWTVSRALRSCHTQVRAVTWFIAAVPVVWMWVATPPDSSKFGYLFHFLATTHLLVAWASAEFIGQRSRLLGVR